MSSSESVAKVASELADDPTVELDVLKAILKDVEDENKRLKKLIIRKAVDVDTGNDVLQQLWDDTEGIIPSTGKAWIIMSAEVDALIELLKCKSTAGDDTK